MRLQRAETFSRMDGAGSATDERSDVSFGRDLGERIRHIFDILFGKKRPEAEAGGAAVSGGAERFMDEGGAVQAGAGEYAEVFFERGGEIDRRHAFDTDGEDADAVAHALRAEVG